MKKFIVLTILAVLAAVSCQKEPQVINVTAVTLDVMSIELTEGETTTLKATVSPDNADNKKVLWTTSNASVATVSNGTVTAVKPGSAIITATSDDGGKTASCTVTVKAKIINVTEVVLSPDTLTLTEDDSETLIATVKPDNATNKNVTWSSSDKTVATVENGKVTAINAGEAIITVTTGDGGKTATCTVTVKSKVIHVSDVSLDKTSASVYVGDDINLTATVYPDNAADKTVSWQSSNKSIATVSDGKVTGVKVGKATITVTTKDGDNKASCEISVLELPKATSLSLSYDSFNAMVGSKHTLKVTVSPSNAKTDLEWSSSDARVLSVSGSGDVASVVCSDYGIASVMVKDKRTGLSATTTITTLVENFKWTENTSETYGGNPVITIGVGQSRKINCSYSPSYATKIFSDLSQFVFYDSRITVLDKPDCFTIDEDGVVTGTADGMNGIKPTGRIIMDQSTNRLYVRVVSSQSESEYNDTKDYANEMIEGIPMYFYLSNSTDEDWFKLPIPSEGGNIKLTVSCKYKGTIPSGEVRICKYAVYDSSMQMRGSGSFTFQNDNKESNTVRTIPAKGAAYIRIYTDYEVARPHEMLELDYSVSETDF